MQAVVSCGVAVAAAAAAAVAAAASLANAASLAAAPRDVLMIAMDDLRPELGSYGCTHMATPHLDSLAAAALQFDNAYVAVAWCSPSRTALLTSRRPDTSRTWSVVPSEYWRERGGNFTTIPQLFKDRGYLTLGVGKIFHPGPASGGCDAGYSWSPESLPYDDRGSACPSGNNAAVSAAKPRAVEAEVVGDVELATPAMSPFADNPDTYVAECANATLARIARLRASGNDTRPFFFAVGLHKPHIPWDVPQQYYDMYPLDSIALPAHRSPPTDTPDVALNNILSGYWADSFSDFGALRANGSITRGNPADGSVLDDYWTRRARQAYWAAVSFTDANVGAVLAALERHGFANDTIVVAWGDHGYQLGGNDQWSKVSNFEQSVRIPLLLRDPRHPRSFGQRTSALFEAVDLMPTLADLAADLNTAADAAAAADGSGGSVLGKRAVRVGGGGAVPACPPGLNASRAVMLCTDGVSAAPLLREGRWANASWWKSAAFSQVPRGALRQGEPGNVAGEEYMGYTVRVARWRYTEWVGFDNTTGVAAWGGPVYGRELYAETLGDSACAFDTDARNVAADPGNAAVVAELSQRLRNLVQRRRRGLA